MEFDFGVKFSDLDRPTRPLDFRIVRHPLDDAKDIQDRIAAARASVAARRAQRTLIQSWAPMNGKCAILRCNPWRGLARTEALGLRAEGLVCDVIVGNGFHVEKTRNAPRADMLVFEGCSRSFITPVQVKATRSSCGGIVLKDDRVVEPPEGTLSFGIHGDYSNMTMAFVDLQREDIWFIPFEECRRVIEQSDQKYDNRFYLDPAQWSAYHTKNYDFNFGPTCQVDNPDYWRTFGMSATTLTNHNNKQAILRRLFCENCRSECILPWDTVSDLYQIGKHRYQFLFARSTRTFKVGKRIEADYVIVIMKDEVFIIPNPKGRIMIMKIDADVNRNLYRFRGLCVACSKLAAHRGCLQCTQNM